MFWRRGSLHSPQASGRSNLGGGGRGAEGKDFMHPSLLFPRNPTFKSAFILSNSASISTVESRSFSAAETRSSLAAWEERKR